MEVKFGATEVHGINFNRTAVMEDGTLITNGRGRKGIVRPLDVVDPSLPVLMFMHDGKPVGAIVNFACHSCCLGQLYVDDPGYSGDYSSELAKQLKAHYGNDFVSIFVLGTCGDITSRDNINYVYPDPPLWYREVGKRLAEGVIRAAEQAEPVPGGVGVIKEVIQIERRLLSQEDCVKMAQHYLMRGSSMLATNLLYYQAANTAKFSELAVQAIRIGDVCISALPGEVFVTYGLAIKAASPFKRNMVVENCNDYCGYIPSKQAFSEKSKLYEAALCFHSCLIPEAGEIIQNKAIALANKLA